jgi:hypothetical protein
MASGTERVPASFVASPLHSSASDLSWGQPIAARLIVHIEQFLLQAKHRFRPFIANLNVELCTCSAVVIAAFALSTMTLPPYESCSQCHHMACEPALCHNIAMGGIANLAVLWTTKRAQPLHLSQRSSGRPQRSSWPSHPTSVEFVVLYQNYNKVN